MRVAAHVILLPIAAMVALSAAVGGALLAQRTAEMRRRRIHPQSVATSSQMAAKLERTNHCSTNRVMHRFAAFAAGFVLLIGMWLVFTLQLVGLA